MIGIIVKTINELHRVQNAAEKGSFRSFSHAAAAIRKTAAQSIEKAEGPSDPGEPPHTHRRVFLRRAFRFFADKQGAVIGPRASVVGTVGQAHEFGGAFRGQSYPQRPFMLPALEDNIPRFAAEWRGSISE